MPTRKSSSGDHQTSREIALTSQFPDLRPEDIGANQNLQLTITDATATNIILPDGIRGIYVTSDQDLFILSNPELDDASAYGAPFKSATVAVSANGDVAANNFHIGNHIPASTPTRFLVDGTSIVLSNESGSLATVNLNTF